MFHCLWPSTLAAPRTTGTTQRNRESHTIAPSQSPHQDLTSGQLYWTHVPARAIAFCLLDGTSVSETFLSSSRCLPPITTIIHILRRIRTL
ncbi:hypothetical protein ACQRIT_007695 [Beauveria bassiana]